MLVAAEKDVDDRVGALGEQLVVARTDTADVIGERRAGELGELGLDVTLTESWLTPPNIEIVSTDPLARYGAPSAGRWANAAAAGSAPASFSNLRREMIFIGFPVN